MSAPVERQRPAEQQPGHAGERAVVEHQSDPTAPLGRVPDFFIIGHENSGTTALYRTLRQHPQIFMPDLKEPRFFVAEPPKDASTRRGKRPHTLEDYLALFTPALPAQLAGEASPQYIRSPDAARLIAEVQPAAKIIALLREPTSFLRSFHNQCVRGRIEDQNDLRKALALEPLRREGKRIPRGSPAPGRLLYSEHVRYVEQLRRFRAEFPAEQVMVIIYEDFRADNDATLRRVMRFLGVEDTVELEKSESVRVRKAVRLQRVHRVASSIQRARRWPAGAGPLARAANALTPRRLQGGALEDLLRRAVFTVPEPLDEELMRELRHRFKGEVELLSECLDRDLVGFWGYDDID